VWPDVATRNWMKLNSKEWKWYSSVYKWYTRWYKIHQNMVLVWCATWYVSVSIWLYGYTACPE
jgi:predicted AlkP superfamily pyrophosphatase or phosphodiesterase